LNPIRRWKNLRAWSKRFARGTVCCVLLVAAGGLAAAAPLEVRIKDITDVDGVRTDKLTGMGLVTGLTGTGGRNPTTRQVLMTLVQKFGQRADPTLRLGIRDDAKEKSENTSVVIVTAELPAFARRGSRMDVLVSALDDASSLQGGQLVLTPLEGVDGEVYAVASGPITIGGFTFSGQAATVQRNFTTTGRVANGATVEKEVCRPKIGHDGRVRFLLREPDFETSRRITEAINATLPGVATSLDPGAVELLVPADQVADINGFIGRVGGLRVAPDVRARVVINERTGTVVVGDNVRLSRVAITHANLSVITGESPVVSQPAPFAERGRTVVVPRTELKVTEERKPINVLDDTATVGDLARALNALGVTPRDLSSIFQMLKESGALHAELELK